jgi:hypothetical protein
MAKVETRTLANCKHPIDNTTPHPDIPVTVTAANGQIFGTIA